MGYRNWKDLITDYVIVLIISISLLVSLITNCAGQVVKKGNIVEMDLNTYRLVRQKSFLCDTALAVKDTIIMQKDTLIEDQRFIIRNYNTIVLQKDSTIRTITKEYDALEIEYQSYIEKSKPTRLERNLPVFCAVIGLLIGVYISK